ncbi:hypothetical protein PO124_25870 [Bacillus licheniformis]|nr:hypothetical protein [Bacillus licheniformis]
MNEAISGWKQKPLYRKGWIEDENQAHPFSLKRINWITSGTTKA